MGAIKNAFHDDLELRRAIEDGEAELQAVAPAPHSASPSGSTNSAFGAVPRFSPDWLNAEVCIENALIAYEDSLCDDDGPVDTVISSGDLGVLIGLAELAAPLRDALNEAVCLIPASQKTALANFNAVLARTRGAQ